MLKRLLFGRKRGKPLKTSEKKVQKPFNLETICADDPEAYEALSDTMLLNPWLIKENMEKEAEKGDFRTAGGLAIYEGNIEKVKEYFGKYSEISKKKLKILEIPERAMKKAQEYYAQKKEQ